MHKPYVVSADVYILMRRWATEKKFKLPSEEFFYQLRQEFLEFGKRIFPGFEIVPEREIVAGLAHLTSQSHLPIVSLDRVYSRAEYHIDICRLVDSSNNDIGLSNRAGTLSLAEQLQRLPMDVAEVALVDDVLFTGEVIKYIISLLKQRNVKVTQVYAGVGVEQGIRTLHSIGCEVHCVRSYDGVEDEICERDFYPGVPFSGRQLEGEDNIGVPYIMPFGNIGAWASIPPQWQLEFSRFCLLHSIRLFKEIESLSVRPVLCGDLSRKIVGLYRNGTRLIAELDALLCSI